MRRIAILTAAVLLLAGCAALPDPGTDLESAVTVTITGGLETDPADGGRPVILIAAALGVPTEVFREAFRGVSPAGAGNDVADELARSNKAALLSVLGPYGITNEHLDAASNHYRYNGSVGELWPTRSATATATVVDGAVTSITITDPGYGYTSAPTVTLSNGQRAIAALAFGLDTATNGSIAAVTVSAGSTTG